MNDNSDVSLLLATAHSPETRCIQRQLHRHLHELLLHSPTVGRSNVLWWTMSIGFCLWPLASNIPQNFIKTDLLWNSRRRRSRRNDAHNKINQPSTTTDKETLFYFITRLSLSLRPSLLKFYFIHERVTQRWDDSCWAATNNESSSSSSSSSSCCPPLHSFNSIQFNFILGYSLIHQQQATRSSNALAII